MDKIWKMMDNVYKTTNAHATHTHVYIYIYIYICADSGVRVLRERGRKKIHEGFFAAGGLRSSIFVARRGVFADLRPEIVEIRRPARRFRRSEASDRRNPSLGAAFSQV